MISLDEKSQDIEEQLGMNEQLINSLEAAQLFYKTSIREETEREECWKMRLEDIRVSLYESTYQALQLSKEAQRLEKVYHALLKEIEKAEIYQERVSKCMQILSKIIASLHKEKQDIDIKQLFSDILVKLQDSSLNALDSYCSSEASALNDPREIMPYRRSADHVPGKTPRISQLRNKPRVSVTTSP